MVPGQKDVNIKNKSDWDRKIYVECVLRHEMYVDVAISSPHDRNCRQDFVLNYTASFETSQKQQFYEIVASHARQEEFVPQCGLSLPIEALRSTVTPIAGA